ncbi:MAG: bifunctional phosphoribosylaminoimidazolecarboxamide formyltransferase/IMP cyclohydrolase [Porphyromonas sp.]|nr:bifunctional phosphoribosylaminoimidazolecarboxamide formyltransferase/IMP cyclohydrolase [Porphyromonas sp.]
MSEKRKIGRALISVFNKDGLEQIVRKLDAMGVEIISTGGTQDFISSLGISCTSVEDLTAYPSILGGRVKTLHPSVFGGILARRGHEEDDRQCDMYGISPIDLVVVDLYPFEETLADGGTHEEIIEKIDVGGVSLIRAAAKNYKDVLVIPSRRFYSKLIQLLDEGAGTTTLDQRKVMAGEAFMLSQNYDRHIAEYLCSDTSDNTLLKLDGAKELRYGENPHQKAVFYGSAFDDRFKQIQGKELSYNNLLDLDAAVHLIEEFEEPTATIMKHNTPCGLATGADILGAYTSAFESDPVSAFGGIIAVNRGVDEKLANKIGEIFFEVLIAPSYTPEALEIFAQKQKRIIIQDRTGHDEERVSYRSVVGGMLVQDRDTKIEEPAELKLVSGKPLTEEQTDDLLFGMKAVKYCKSNAIVLVKGGQMVGAGYGQTSRVDALKQAIEKAKTLGFSLEGAALASDAFFPFSDCVELAHQAGITSIIQPGGSIRDDESTELAESYGISMVHTGVRHFRH